MNEQNILARNSVFFEIPLHPPECLTGICCIQGNTIVYKHRSDNFQDFVVITSITLNHIVINELNRASDIEAQFSALQVVQNTVYYYLTTPRISPGNANADNLCVIAMNEFPTNQSRLGCAGT